MGGVDLEAGGHALRGQGDLCHLLDDGPSLSYTRDPGGSMLAVFAFGSIALAADPTCDNVVGAWHNPLNSTLTITALDPKTSQLTGNYISPSGTAGDARPLVGWVNSAAPGEKQDNVKVISFAVNWGTYGSITSWTGYVRVTDGKPVLTTLWHLSRANSSFTWDHIITNTDVFVPGPPSK